VLSIEVGERLSPGPGRWCIAISTPYLEAPVAGGFEREWEAMLAYPFVLKPVKERLSYLDEEISLVWI
jgi:hypothetical protein